MKKILLHTLLLSLLLLVFMPSGFGQINLEGRWKAHCLVEMVSDQTVSFCEFCPMNINGTTLVFNSFELIFTKGSFDLVVGNVVSKIDYVMDDERYKLLFTHSNKPFSFSLIVIQDKEHQRYVLKDEEGGLILIEKM